MKYKLIILLIFSLLTISSFGQENIKEFRLQKPSIRKQKSKYNTIIVVDSRIDTTSMGIVQVGLMNNPAKVVTLSPLSMQLSDYLSSVIDSSAQNGTLVFQVRQFLFAETTTMTSEKGYFFIRANLFAKSESNYKKLASIDTMLVISALDVTNRLLKTASDIVTNCILSCLEIPPLQDELYSFKDIIRVDSIEKRKIKVYNLNEYKDGLYTSYYSFKNQIPDKEIMVSKKRDGSIAKVMFKDSIKGLVKVQSNEVYAFVNEGEIYISTGYGYYPLYFSSDNFYFVGKVKPMTTNNNHIITAEVMFGLIGGIIASNMKEPGEKYFIIIDHINGGFVQLRKMPINQ